MDTLFAPGCALKAYKPHLIQRMTDFLIEKGIIVGTYDTCCKKPKTIEEDIVLIICCPGCNRMFETAFSNVRPVSLWKILLDTDFPFPDYHGKKMTIHDACRSRNRNSPEMQISVRALCKRMNIEIIEPIHTLDETRCCGGCAVDYETQRKMAQRRVLDFSENDVVVYCTGCVRSLSLTEVHPRHMFDLLFAESTEGLTVITKN